MNRRQIGIGLVVGALLLVGAALFLWQSGSDEAAKDRLAEEYRATSLGVPADEVDANRTGPIALSVVAGVAAIAGTIVLVSPSTDS